MSPSRPAVAVCGASLPTAAQAALAEEVGGLLARRGVLVVCGGLGGVMASVARGAAAAGGSCLGLLPGDDLAGAAPDLSLALPTGLGELRNALVVRAAGAVIAIGGGYGTLSEIALARRLGRPVALLDSWQPEPPDPGPGASPVGADDADLHVAEGAVDAVAWALDRLSASSDPLRPPGTGRRR